MSRRARLKTWLRRVGRRSRGRFKSFELPNRHPPAISTHLSNDSLETTGTGVSNGQGTTRHPPAEGVSTALTPGQSTTDHLPVKTTSTGTSHSQGITDQLQPLVRETDTLASHCQAQANQPQAQTNRANVTSDQRTTNQPPVKTTSPGVSNGEGTVILSIHAPANWSNTAVGPSQGTTNHPPIQTPSTSAGSGQGTAGRSPASSTASNDGSKGKEAAKDPQTLSSSPPVQTVAGQGTSNQSPVTTPSTAVSNEPKTPAAVLDNNPNNNLRAVLSKRGYPEDCDLNWALGRACDMGHDYIVWALLCKGIPASAPSSYQRDPPLPGASTPLHIATHAQQVDVFERLAKNGADLNARDEAGRTPLYYAVERDVVGLLLKHGADVDVRDNAGDTPLDAAIKDRRDYAIVALLARGATPTVPMFPKLTPRWARQLHQLGGVEVGNLRVSDPEAIRPFVDQFWSRKI